jgi:hypothetical protein
LHLSRTRRWVIRELTRWLDQPCNISARATLSVDGIRKGGREKSSLTRTSSDERRSHLPFALTHRSQ